MNTPASLQVLDKNFVVAASVIGTVYAAIVVMLGSLVGKEAAGVAGVSLTTIATGIFRQFETLRFRQISQEEQQVIPVPTISWWRLIAFANTFLGLKVFFGMIFGVLLASSGLVPKISGMESFIELLSDWKILVALVGLNFVIFVLGGFVIARAFQIRTYSTLLIAALISCLLEGLLPLIPVAIQEFDLFVAMLKSGALWPAAFWLIFVAAALLGARLANRKLAQPHAIPQSA
jgi:hypothetical protein